MLCVWKRPGGRAAKVAALEKGSNYHGVNKDRNGVGMIVEEVETVEQEVGKISKDDVRKALKRMRNGKAVGSDDILVEVWKCQ